MVLDEIGLRRGCWWRHDGLGMVCVGDFCEGIYFIFFMFGLIVDEIGNGSSALTVAAWLCCGEADFGLSICEFFWLE